MFGGYLYKILSISVQKPAVIQCGRKNFIHDGHFHKTKFQFGFLRIHSFLLGNVEKFIHIKKYNYMSNISHNYLPNRKALFLEDNLFQFFKCSVSKIPLSMKKHSVQVVKMWTRQCECVLAQRIRRGQQMFSLYSRMWGETALKNFISKIRQQFYRKSKEILLSAAGVSVYNWEKMKITDKDICCFVNEIENVYHLRNSTITCQDCHRRIMFDTQVPSIQYCECSGSKSLCSTDEGWVPFIERKDTVVWRKENPENRGLYAYKVYASYDDVTAYDFLCVQLDTEYRKEWDRTAVELRIVDSDPTSNSDIVYWVMKWPRMFSNRDYVFNRRFKIDGKDKVMIVMSKCTEHPRCPKRQENIRVNKYWSSMVIRPYKEFSEPGIEFCLTYFEDPGVSIPSTITSWVAISGLPDFLARLREAARQLAERRKSSDYDWIPSSEPDPEPLPESSPSSACNIQSDTSPKVPLTSSQTSHQDLQDSYLQLSTARLFL